MEKLKYVGLVVLTVVITMYMLSVGGLRGRVASLEKNQGVIINSVNNVVKFLEPAIKQAKARQQETEKSLLQKQETAKVQNTTKQVEPLPVSQVPAPKIKNQAKREPFIK